MSATTAVLSSLAVVMASVGVRVWQVRAWARRTMPERRADALRVVNGGSRKD